jgi:hypothetical protein
MVERGSVLTLLMNEKKTEKKRERVKDPGQEKNERHSGCRLIRVGILLVALSLFGISLCEPIHCSQLG